MAEVDNHEIAAPGQQLVARPRTAVGSPWPRGAARLRSVPTIAGEEPSHGQAVAVESMLGLPVKVIREGFAL